MSTIYMISDRLTDSAGDEVWELNKGIGAFTNKDKAERKVIELNHCARGMNMLLPDDCRVEEIELTD